MKKWQTFLLTGKILAVVGSMTSPCFGELRELSTDRPDTTESPFTVDAAHFQIEMEIATWTKDGSDGETSLGEMNLKFGLDAMTDLQMVTPAYTFLRDGGEGWGNMQIRLKRNLWGNDGGNTALAVMPYVELPTADEGFGSDHVQGGIIVPFAFSMGEWGMGLQAEFSSIHEEGRYHWQAMFSATASREITASCSMFLEMVSMHPEGRTGESEYYLNSGLTWAATNMVQWDAGLRIGLNEEAADITPFLGFSRKF
jgi:hypothetical protein